jgi:hypothetical protein
MPYWIQVLQALATPTIAVLAAVIGLMQWRTAHQRAVLGMVNAVPNFNDSPKVITGNSAGLAPFSMRAV